MDQSISRDLLVKAERKEIEREVGGRERERERGGKRGGGGREKERRKGIGRISYKSSIAMNNLTNSILFQNK